MRRIVLGTRGSELARAQTALVETALRAAWPGIEIALEVITTRGDEKHNASYLAGAGRKGLFTSEIEHALLERRIDVAVHSAKDLPSEPTSGLELEATLPRAAVEDVLVSKTSNDLASLPRGACLATGSVRRQHQLRWLRPDLQLVELRGNVPTRLRKLLANSWEGIVLAQAGLERLGLFGSEGEMVFERRTLRVSVLAAKQFLPAGGQGIVALQARTDDEPVRGLLRPINHAETLTCLRAEREFLRLLQGDCGTPVGVLATIQNAAIEIRAQLFDGVNAEPRVATLRREMEQAEPETMAAELLGLING